MASSYYDSSGKNVVDGDVAYAADLNDINSATDTGFQLVEAAVDAIAANQSYYADLAEKWAENPEDTAVEPGKYSALHWAAKAEDDATQTAADRVQTGLDAVATAADRVQTGLDAVATAADRVQTGLDRTAAESAAITSTANAKGRNYIINGNFDIWQRAVSQTTSGYGSDDRWSNDGGGSTKVHSVQSFALGQTAVPNNPRYFSRTVVTSVVGFGHYTLKQQKIESVISFSGSKATLSFWAKADSAKNIAISFVQYFGSGGSPSPTVTGIAATKILLSTTWNKYTLTVDIPSISGKTLGTDNNDYLSLEFWFDADSAYNARTASLGQQSGTFDIAQVQLEEGDVATAFERRTYDDELKLCQRYFISLGKTTAQSFKTYGYCPSAGNELQFPMLFPTTMRATPAGSVLGTWVTTNVTSAGLQGIHENGFSFQIIGAGTGIAAVVTNTADDLLTFDAEI